MRHANHAEWVRTCVKGYTGKHKGSSEPEAHQNAHFLGNLAVEEWNLPHEPTFIYVPVTHAELRTKFFFFIIIIWTTLRKKKKKKLKVSQSKKVSMRVLETNVLFSIHYNIKNWDFICFFITFYPFLAPKTHACKRSPSKFYIWLNKLPLYDKLLRCSSHPWPSDRFFSWHEISQVRQQLEEPPTYNLGAAQIPGRELICTWMWKIISMNNYLFMSILAGNGSYPRSSSVKKKKPQNSGQASRGIISTYFPHLPQFYRFIKKQQTKAKKK